MDVHLENNSKLRRSKILQEQKVNEPTCMTLNAMIKNNKREKELTCTKMNQPYAESFRAIF